VGRHADAAVELRRAIHRNPELGHEEKATTALVAGILEEAGLDPLIREAGTGLTVEVGDSGPLLGFRADLDALPLDEENVLPFASEVPGVMHACGHDAHTAIGVGIARVLAGMDRLPGRVRFVFQPAEEVLPGGAEAMLKEGAMEGITSIIAFHVDPSIPPGSIGLRADAITGASDRLHVVLTGPGGHTSRPHQTVDLVQAAARLVTDLPVHAGRRNDPRSPMVMVFGRISGGRTENVIPSRVEVGGTVRLFDLDVWRDLPPLIERLVHEIVAPLGATAEVRYDRGAPPVVNDPAVVAAVRHAATEVLGPDGVLPTHQSLGAEDFAWLLEAAPGALIRLGSALPDRRVDLHSAGFDLDERAIPIGMMVGVASLLRLMEAA
jgi:amidohydrolase